jgi:tRNA(Ile)-lysidine synthase
VIDLSRLSHILQQDCQLVPASLVLIGVSGGPDSLCLLDILYRLGYSLMVAHLNHGLRKEAVADELAVREAARARGLSYISKTADVAGYADKNSISLEEAAREVRYRFLFTQARRCQAQAVIVAHTADDQIETVLMHLLRGAGLSGLKGMKYRSLPNPWSKEIALVRPMLDVFRDDIQAYCAGTGLHPVFDHSNLDTTLFRNRIRQELIPTLETYNPGVKSHLLRMAQTLAGDDQAIEMLTQATWQKCCSECSAMYVALKKENLQLQPLGLQRRLVRRAIAILRPGLRDIDFDTVEKILSYVQKPSRSGHLDLSSGLKLMQEGKTLWLASNERDLPNREWPQVSNEWGHLCVPDYVDLPGSGGWHFLSESVSYLPEAIAQAQTNADPFQVWIDVSMEQPVFSIRPPRPGDRFQPLGMDGHSVKLSDFFINVKMPKRARQLWPLVCKQDEIVWVPGYRQSHMSRLTPQTTKAILIKLIKD